MRKLGILFILGIFCCSLLIAKAKDPISFLIHNKGKNTILKKTNTDELKLELARHVVLSDEHPSLVWDNLGNRFNYELTVGSSKYMVPPSNEDTVSVKIKPFQNTAAVSIKVFRDSKLITELAPCGNRGFPKKHSVRWMTDSETEMFNQVLQTRSRDHSGNLLMIGNYLEQKEMWVAAMNYYQQYLTDNPDEIEMAPYLFRVYKKLKLKKIYHKELTIWVTAMKE